MGTGRLRKKDELRYRKGSTNETQNCRWCRYYIAEHPIVGLRGEDLGTRPRCRIMGLGSSRRYNVRPDYRCEAQETTYKPPKRWRS